MHICVKGTKNVSSANVMAPFINSMTS
jgi:hypothetical protein